MTAASVALVLNLGFMTEVFLGWKRLGLIELENGCPEGITDSRDAESRKIAEIAYPPRGGFFLAVMGYPFGLVKSGGKDFSNVGRKIRPIPFGAITPEVRHL